MNINTYPLNATPADVRTAIRLWVIAIGFVAASGAFLGVIGLVRGSFGG